MHSGCGPEEGRRVRRKGKKRKRSTVFPRVSVSEDGAVTEEVVCVSVWVCNTPVAQVIQL